MSVKTETINSKGYIAIAELKENYVFLQPAGVNLTKIWVVESKHISPHLHGKRHKSEIGRSRYKPAIGNRLKPENTKNTRNRLLSKVSRSLNLGPSLKLYSKSSLLEYTKAIEDSTAGIRGIVDKNFEIDFYKSYKNHDRIRFISNSKINISLESDLVYKFFKLNSPYSNSVYSIFFRPSEYLSLESDIWKLISILGEEFFAEQLLANHSIVNEVFISSSFEKSGQVCFISKENKKIFASVNERIKNRNPDVKEISLSNLLKIFDVNKVEEVLEKGELKFSL